MSAALSREIFALLQPLLGLPEKARRVVITLAIDEAAIVEVETLLPRPDGKEVANVCALGQKYELRAVGDPTVIVRIDPPEAA